MRRIVLPIAIVAVLAAAYGLFGRRDPAPRGYDVVVVGGGLAGLTAGAVLAPRRVLLLEKESRLGGRVFTRTEAGVTYELGALFAYDPAWLPFEVATSQPLGESGPIGLALAGKVYWGESVAEVIAQIGPTPEELRALRAWEEARPEAPELASPRLLAALNGFFQAIHPGDVTDYVPARRADALVRYPTARFAQGNGRLVDELAGRVHGDAVFSAEVTAVAADADGVTVSYRSPLGEKSVRARAVIVATPAGAARRLVAGMSPATDGFLESVTYGSGRVLSMVVKAEALAPFSYVVMPGSRISAVFQAPTADPARRLLTAYWIDGSVPAAGRSAEDDLREVLGELARRGVAKVSREAVLAGEARQWPVLGTRITPAAYGAFDPSTLRPHERVFLAGDYTVWENQWQMPYGMGSAIRSGDRAARQARVLFER